MFELEEMLQQVKELEKKLKELGDSLWHCFKRKSYAGIRVENTRSGFLEWYWKFNKSVARNKSVKK